MEGGCSCKNRDRGLGMFFGNLWDFVTMWKRHISLCEFSICRNLIRSTKLQAKHSLPLFRLPRRCNWSLRFFWDIAPCLWVIWCPIFRDSVVVTKFRAQITQSCRVTSQKNGYLNHALRLRDQHLSLVFGRSCVRSRPTYRVTWRMFSGRLTVHWDRPSRNAVKLSCTLKLIVAQLVRKFLDGSVPRLQEPKSVFYAVSDESNPRPHNIIWHSF
jgi:hypothetical protein